MTLLTESNEKYTYNDYEKLPEGAPYQLINGELVMTPAPTTYHQRIIRRIFKLLDNHVEGNSLGEIFFSLIDVYFSETDTYQPDIVYIAKDRSSIIGEKKIEGSPDLIIEILSPATADYDLRHKKKIYERFGVQEYWIVDPMEKSVDVYKNTSQLLELDKRYEESEILRSLLLEGFEMDLGRVF